MYLQGVKPLSLAILCVGGAAWLFQLGGVMNGSMPAAHSLYSLWTSLGLIVLVSLGVNVLDRTRR